MRALVLAFLAATVALGCDEKKTDAPPMASASAPAPVAPPPVAATAPSASAAAAAADTAAAPSASSASGAPVPTQEDYEKQAETAINTANVEAELSKLEKEVP